MCYRGTTLRLFSETLAGLSLTLKHVCAYFDSAQKLEGDVIVRDSAGSHQPPALCKNVPGTLSLSLLVDIFNSLLFQQDRSKLLKVALKLLSTSENNLSSKKFKNFKLKRLTS